MSLKALLMSSVQSLSRVRHLRPHGLQHTRLVCQLPTPRVCSDSDAHQVGDAIQPSHPVIPFFLCLQSFPASGPFLMSQFFTSGGQISELQFQHHSLNECSGLISFRKDWLDLLAVQETIKSLLQHHSSKASILLCSAFFIVQLSHPHVTTGKTIDLTRWNFADKIMSLLFSMLSRLVITFLPRSKHLLISWLPLFPL